MSSAQAGVLGESLFAAYCLRTTDGELEVYRPVSDDDHRDFEINRRSGFGGAWVQVKTAIADTDGRIWAHAGFKAAPLEDPRFIYAVLYVPDLTIDTAWLIPSADFNRLAYHEADHGGTELILDATIAGTDKWTAYRVPPLELGPRLLAALPPTLRTGRTKPAVQII